MEILSLIWSSPNAWIRAAYVEKRNWNVNPPEYYFDPEVEFSHWFIECRYLPYIVADRVETSKSNDKDVNYSGYRISCHVQQSCSQRPYYVVHVSLVLWAIQVGFIELIWSLQATAQQPAESHSQTEKNQCQNRPSNRSTSSAGIFRVVLIARRTQKLVYYDLVCRNCANQQEHQTKQPSTGINLLNPSFHSNTYQYWRHDKYQHRIANDNRQASIEHKIDGKCRFDSNQSVKLNDQWIPACMMLGGGRRSSMEPSEMKPRCSRRRSRVFGGSAEGRRTCIPRGLARMSCRELLEIQLSRVTLESYLSFNGGLKFS